MRPPRRHLQVLAYVEGKGQSAALVRLNDTGGNLTKSLASLLVAHFRQLRCAFLLPMVMRATIFFLLLQGTIGFEQHIDKCLDLSQYLYNKIKNREGYQMVFDGVVGLSSTGS